MTDEKDKKEPFTTGIRQGRRPNKAKIDLAMAFGEKKASQEAVVVSEVEEPPPVVKERKPRPPFSRKDKAERRKRMEEKGTKSGPKPKEPKDEFASHSDRMKAYWAKKKADKPDPIELTPEEKEKAVKRRYNPNSLSNLRGVKGNQKGDGQSPATKAMHQDLKDVWQFMQERGGKTSLKWQARKDPRWFYELVKGCFPKDVFVQQMVDVSKMSEQQINDEIVKLLKANGVGVSENTYNKGTEDSALDKQICDLLTESQGEVKH